MERFGPRRAGRSSTISNIEKTHWCGLSMGGMVGQWAGRQRRPETFLARSSSPIPALPLSGSDQLAEPHQGREGRAASKRSPITVIAGWLTADFREREPQVAANMKAIAVGDAGRGLSRLLRRRCRRWINAKLLPKIKSPTLVIGRPPRHGDARFRPANSSAAGFPAPA